MYIFEGESFNDVYKQICESLYKIEKYTEVRGLNVKEMTPCVFTINNPKDRLLSYNTMRDIKRYIFGELLWYLSGDDSVNFISKYSKMWKNLTDDGVTNNSAYGKYIFRPQIGGGISQWEWVKSKIKQDIHTRQAVIHIKPIQCYESKDYVCTLTLSFYVRDNKLNLVVNMRSNDIWYGLTYDVFMFTFLQELMAAELGLEVGKYYHMTNNMHIYQKDIDKSIRMLESGYKTEELPKINVDFREKDLPLLLELEHIYWHDFNVKKDIQSKIDKLSDMGKYLLKMLINY